MIRSPMPAEDPLARYAAGACSLVDVARALGISREAARLELARCGIPVRSPGRPGGSSHLAGVLTEDYLRREYADARRSVADLAAELGCTQKTVCRYLLEHGITRRDERPEPPVISEGELWLRYVVDGQSVSRIAADLGCSQAIVRSLLEIFDVPRPGGGSGTGWSREALWDAYVVEGASTTAIADAIGCAASTVARDLRRHGIPLRRRGGAPSPSVRRRERKAGIRRGVVAADT